MLPVQKAFFDLRNKKLRVGIVSTKEYSSLLFSCLDGIKNSSRTSDQKKIVNLSFPHKLLTIIVRLAPILVSTFDPDSHTQRVPCFVFQIPHSLAKCNKTKEGALVLAFAESAGFEPARVLMPCLVSSEVPSAAQPTLHIHFKLASRPKETFVHLTWTNERVKRS